MQKFFRSLVLLAAVLIIIIMCQIMTFATDYPDMLRVGIYYGSGTVSSLTIQSFDGFSAGITNVRTFYPLDTVSGTSVTVSRGTAGKYYLQYASCKNSEEMTSILQELRSQGIYAFPALSGQLYLVLGDSFSTEADATAYIQATGISASVYTHSANTLSLTDTASGKILFISDYPGGNITIHSKDIKNPDALLTISGAAKGTYRGGFECSLATDGNLAVTNLVPTEWYLYSVVSREMSPGWPMEALKAQTVCARTFALRSTKHKKTYNFDVCPTTCCQVYSSNADTTQSIHTAVDETCGQVLLYNNSLIEAVYFSSAGSSTANAKDVWGGDVPYLVSVENPYEDTENINKGKWSNKLTTTRATELMSKYGIGTVTDISAVEYSPDGRVIKLRVTGTNGEKIFERDSCRSAFSEATLSQKYTVTKGGVRTFPSVFTVSGTETTQITLDNISVISGSGNIQKVNDSYSVFDGNTKKLYTVTTDSKDPDTYTFTGEGWGHGVGMSQYGAKGMAEAGFKYDQILTHYYTGVNIHQAY